MNTEYLKNYRRWEDKDKNIVDETLIAVPRRTTLGFWKDIREFIYGQGFKTPFLSADIDDDKEVGTSYVSWANKPKSLPPELFNSVWRFGCIIDALLESEMMETPVRTKSKDGKALNSRPRIIDDCRQRVDDIKNDLETMKEEYEDWGEKINQGATQDKCNDAVDTLYNTISQLEEIESELDSLLGELPQGFGRD